MMSQYIEGFMMGAAIAGSVFGFLVAYRGGFRDTQYPRPARLNILDPSQYERIGDAKLTDFKDFCTPAERSRNKPRCAHSTRGLFHSGA